MMKLLHPKDEKRSYWNFI